MTIPSGMRHVRLRKPLSVEDGGTGERTPVEAAASLGVPTLGGNNVLTGVNEFQGLLQSNGGVEITLPSDSLNVVNSSGQISVLDFSVTSGRVYTLPDSEGTVALSGDPVRAPYNAQGSSYAASDSDCVISATGTITVTLPAVSGVSGKMLWVKNAGVGTVTVDGYETETIDGALTATLAAGAAIHVVSNGSNWLVL